MDKDTMNNETSKASLTDKTVLLIEDESEGRELLIRFLQMIGCKKIVSMGSGEEALYYLLSNTPDLVLLDYRLPGMSGLWTLRQIKQATPNVPVIMMTAYPTHEVTLKALQEGAFDLAVKPLNLRQLEKQMLQILAT